MTICDPNPAALIAVDAAWSATARAKAYLNGYATPAGNAAAITALTDARDRCAEALKALEETE